VSQLWSCCKFIFRFGLVASLDMCRLVWRMRSDWNKLAAEDRVSINSFDTISVHQFCQKFLWTNRVRSLVATGTRELLCASPTEVSYLALLEGFEGAGTFDNLLTGAQESVVQGGTWTVLERLVELIEKSGKVAGILNAVVVAITYDRLTDPDWPVTLTLLGGQRIHCQRIIIACPPTAYRRIHFSPPLPIPHQHIANVTQMGTVVKVILVYEQKFWLDRPSTVMFLKPTETEEISDNLLGAVVDGSNDTVDALVVLMTANSAIIFSTMSEAKQKEMILQHVAKHVGAEALHPKHYVCQNWSNNPHVMGGYQIVWPLGWLSRNYEGCHVLDVLSQPRFDHHMFFAGADISQKWNGYMDGAVSTAERAVKQLLATLK
jgi:monoamine oxidase